MLRLKLKTWAPLLLCSIWLAPACSEQSDSRTSSTSSAPHLRAPFPSNSPAQPSQSAPQPSPWQQAKSWHTDSVEPPAEYYSAVLRELRQRAQPTNLLLSSESHEDESETPILYVDFDGEDMQYGFGTGESFILCDDEASLPAAGLSLAEQEQVLIEVQRYFEDANVLVNITDVRPQQGDYTTVYVTGAIDDLGCEEDDRVLGIAPLDRGNNNPNDIGFAFTSNLDPEEDDLVYMTAVVIAHEAGHTYGLSHNDNDDAIMFASVQKDVTGFGVGYARKLIFKTRQDSPKVLRKGLGVLDPDLLPEDETEADNFKGSWCDRIANVQGFVLANFTGFGGDTSWLQPPEYCEE